MTLSVAVRVLLIKFITMLSTSMYYESITSSNTAAAIQASTTLTSQVLDGSSFLTLHSASRIRNALHQKIPPTKSSPQRKED